MLNIMVILHLGESFLPGSRSAMAFIAFLAAAMVWAMCCGRGPSR